MADEEVVVHVRNNKQAERLALKVARVLQPKSEADVDDYIADYFVPWDGTEDSYLITQTERQVFSGIKTSSVFQAVLYKYARGELQQNAAPVRKMTAAKRKKSPI